MEKHQHTPGPWTWKSVPSQGAGDQVQWNTMVGTPTKEKGYNFDEMICEVMPTDAQGKQELGESFLQSQKRKQEANAILIAQAPLIPELVERLRELADLQNGPPLFKYEAEWNGAMKKTYALLAKTETR